MDETDLVIRVLKYGIASDLKREYPKYCRAWRAMEIATIDLTRKMVQQGVLPESAFEGLPSESDGSELDKIVPLQAWAAIEKFGIVSSQKEETPDLYARIVADAELSTQSFTYLQIMFAKAFVKKLGQDKHADMDTLLAETLSLDFADIQINIEDLLHPHLQAVSSVRDGGREGFDYSRELLMEKFLDALKDVPLRERFDIANTASSIIDRFLGAAKLHGYNDHKLWKELDAVDQQGQLPERMKELSQKWSQELYAHVIVDSLMNIAARKAGTFAEAVRQKALSMLGRPGNGPVRH